MIHSCEDTVANSGTATTNNNVRIAPGKIPPEPETVLPKTASTAVAPVKTTTNHITRNNVASDAIASWNTTTLECNHDDPNDHINNSNHNQNVNNDQNATRIVDEENQTIKQSSSKNNNECDNEEETKRNYNKKIFISSRWMIGTGMSILNILLDTYGVLLIKQYGTRMSIWEINLIRFGFAGLCMIGISIGFILRDHIMILLVSSTTSGNSSSTEEDHQNKNMIDNCKREDSSHSNDNDDIQSSHCRMNQSLISSSQQPELSTLRVPTALDNNIIITTGSPTVLSKNAIEETTQPTIQIQTTSNTLYYSLQHDVSATNYHTRSINNILHENDSRIDQHHIEISTLDNNVDVNPTAVTIRSLELSHRDDKDDKKQNHSGHHHDVAIRTTSPKWYYLPISRKKNSNIDYGMTKKSWIRILIGTFFVTFITPTLSNYALFQIALALALTLGSTGPIYSLFISHYLLQSKNKRGSLSSSSSPSCSHKLFPPIQSTIGTLLSITGIILLAFRGSVSSADE
jgi:hypothetical protein